MSDEWRVEVDLDDTEHGYTLGERLRSVRLDDETRERLGERAIVTRDGPRLFVYAVSEDATREAERVVRELIADEKLTADVAVTRWHPDAGEWKDASVPLPETPAQRRAEYDAKEAAALRAAEATGEFPFEVSVELSAAADAMALARSLQEEGMSVRRRWRHVLVGTPTVERANELAARLEAELPEDAHVAVEAHDVQYPPFMLVGLAS